MMIQEKVFRRQIELAIELKLPLVFHLRAKGADSTVFSRAEEIMKESNLPTDWHIHNHCWTRDIETAKQWKNT